MIYFFEGVLTGLLLSVSPGPVFFTLIETSISRGYKRAIYLALGVFITDISIILLSIFFSRYLINHLTNNPVFTWIAAVFFMIAGLIKVILPIKSPVRIQADDHPYGNLQNLVKGMLVNGLNPALFIFWIALATLYKQKSPEAPLYYFSGVLLITLSMDILKSIYSARIFAWTKVVEARWLVRITGLVFVFFGLAIVIREILQAGNYLENID